MTDDPDHARDEAMLRSAAEHDARLDAERYRPSPAQWTSADLATIAVVIVVLVIILAGLGALLAMAVSQ